MRKNPPYQPWHEFTVAKCEKCGEFYEPACDIPHRCGKQNSYPAKEPKKSALESAMIFGSFVSGVTNGGYSNE